MRSKKLLAVAISIVLCMSMLVGCGPGDKKKSTKKSSSFEEKVSKDEGIISKVTSKEDAQEVAIEFVRNNLYIISESVYNCDSISNFEIANIRIPSEDPWYVYVKGTFYAKDEYGSVVGLYKYDWKLKVDALCNVKSISVKTIG